MLTALGAGVAVVVSGFEGAFRTIKEPILTWHITTTPGATLPTFESSAANAAKLESFVRSGVSGLPAVAGADGCLVYEVYGADLARGALDVYIGVPGGACGGDAAGSYYQIRDRRVVATVAHCGDCDPPDSTVTRFTAPYRNRPAAGLFTIRSGGASDWRLVGGAPG